MAATKYGILDHFNGMFMLISVYEFSDQHKHYKTKIKEISGRKNFGGMDIDILQYKRHICDIYIGIDAVYVYILQSQLVCDERTLK